MSLTKVTYAMIEGALVNVLDYGAVGDGIVDDSAAIQAAIDTGNSVVFSEGTYLANNLTQSVNGQRFYGSGNAIIKKNDDGVLFTGSGRDIMFEGIKFDGNVNFTGDCVKLTGDNPVLTNCSIWTKNGFGLLSEGNGTRIIGTSDIYYSDDATGYAICLGNTLTNTNYHQIVGITTSTSPSGILLRKANGSCTGSQVGAFIMDDGAMFVSNCRITGNLGLGRSNFAQVDNCTIAGDVIIGDGVNTLSGVGFGPNVFMQTGTTLTLNSRIRESSIFTAQLANTTVTDNLTGTAVDIDNFIYTKPISYTPTWTATGTAPSLGNGSLTGSYFRNGRTVCATVELLIGSTTTTGTGDWRFQLPSIVQINWIGSAIMTDSGTQYIGAPLALGGQNLVAIAANNAGNVGPTVPFTWATGDVLRFSVQYETT
jgi:hypothetical protein